MIPSPQYLILMLTNRCNLSCSYCYLGRHKKRADLVHGTAHDIVNDTGMDMSKTTIDQALTLVDKDQKSLHVQLTGGEPFLVPHLV